MGHHDADSRGSIRYVVAAVIILAVAALVAVAIAVVHFVGG